MPIYRIEVLVRLRSQLKTKDEHGAIRFVRSYRRVFSVDAESEPAARRLVEATTTDGEISWSESGVRFGDAAPVLGDARDNPRIIHSTGRILFIDDGA